MEHKHHEDELRAILAWYRDMGVDAALVNEPIDWLARGDVAATEPPPGLDQRRTPSQRAAQPMASPGSSAPSTGRTPPVVAPTAATALQAPGPAREAARGARTLDELSAALARFDGCGLKATAKNLCFYRGAARARIMMIGEAPGRDEDIEGKPFVGRAGQLLDKMLGAIGLSEANVHITNVVYWRPPGNRTPAAQETEACRPFLERQIELVGPEFIVLLGGAATQHVLGAPEGIMKVRGSWREATIGGKTYRAMPTLHPAYLLRTAAHKRLAWRDLLAIKTALGA